ncbi:hypothetical protein KOR42_45190 [Thalassoglobus neptunius]|uniref:Uncharacterized protein n=1 Tax=Thalassoglobus neptunius TaxID=1938619 RepID=A0A5C5VZ60_9PLAN|nr:hypothetical protein [Thalassoglobus neptunius]TWT43059.1 hypothetical protein KOR42_45190 [Thalassoglobus neptunius]
MAHVSTSRPLRSFGLLMITLAITTFCLAAKTEKSVTPTTVLARNDAASTVFRPGRGCRVLNPTGGDVTFTVYEFNPFTQSLFLCEDISEITISSGCSKDLGPKVFACHSIQLRLSTPSTATLYAIPGE